MKRGRSRRAVAVVVVAVIWASVVAPVAAFAAGNDVGANLSEVLRHFAGEVYAGLVSVVSVVFLINRRYPELAKFVGAALLVGWLVFSPDQVAHTARSIGNQIF